MTKSSASSPRRNPCLLPALPTGLLLGLIPGLVLLGSSCRNLPPRHGSKVEILVGGAALSQKNPLEVVCAPVIDETEGDRLPLEELRLAFHSGLVKRRYSPLSLEYVDRQVVDAAYIPGTLGEQAVLKVVVREWDTRMLETHSAVFVDLDAMMLDPAASEGEALWAGRIKRRFDLGSDLPSATVGTLNRRVAEAVSREFLAAMPARQTAP